MESMPRTELTARDPPVPDFFFPPTNFRQVQHVWNVFAGGFK